MELFKNISEQLEKYGKIKHQNSSEFSENNPSEILSKIYQEIVEIDTSKILKNDIPLFEIPIVYALRNENQDLVNLIFQSLSEIEVVKMLNYQTRNETSAFSEIFNNIKKKKDNYLTFSRNFLGNRHHLLPQLDPFLKLSEEEIIGDFKFIHPLLYFMIKENHFTVVPGNKQEGDTKFLEIFDIIGMY